jgi:hypothetical protein
MRPHRIAKGMLLPIATGWLATAMLTACARTTADDAATAPTSSPSAAAQAAAPASTEATAPAAQAAASSDAATSASADSVPGLPGLPGNGGLNTRGGHYAAPPPATAAFLLALPTRDILASRELRQRWLDTKTAYVVDVPQAGGDPDHLVIDKNAPDFHFWLRSFRGSDPSTTGYIVQARVRCGDLDGLKLQEPLPEARAACAKPNAEYADSGLRAYRVVAGQAPEDVTSTLQNPATALGAHALKRYEGMGASGPYLDASRLDKAPIFRWTIEFDPENPLPASDPRAFDHGGALHAGFVVWSGDRFESRERVPATLWPCAKDGPSSCIDDDRFAKAAE